ncbi:YgaP family membrane protein [Sulfurimonas sp.]
MCFNAGKADRIVRVVAGLGLIAFGLLNENLIVAGIGAIPLITGAIGFCPFYPVFKLNTGCKKD